MQSFETNFRSVNFHVSQSTCALGQMTQGGSSRTGLWRLQSAYSLNWVDHEIWGQGGGETLALL